MSETAKKSLDLLCADVHIEIRVGPNERSLMFHKITIRNLCDYMAWKRQQRIDAIKDLKDTLSPEWTQEKLVMAGSLNTADLDAMYTDFAGLAQVIDAAFKAANPDEKVLLSSIVTLDDLQKVFLELAAASGLVVAKHPPMAGPPGVAGPANGPSVTPSLPVDTQA